MSDSVGSVSVEVVPDARGWSEKLRAQLRDQQVEVKAKADTEEANVELDKVARTRTARVKVNVDKNPLEQGAKSLDSFVGKLGLLPALAVAAGAALVPLAGTLGGIAAALAAPLAIAGGGATLFGVLAGFAVKDTEKQLKVIDSAQKKLDGLTKGTKAYAAQAKVLADAQKSLSPAQRQFSNAQSNFGASFQNFIGGKAGEALLSPLVQGMNLLSGLLPHLTPIITAASDAFSTLLGGIGKAASSPGFDKFIHTVSGQVGHDIVGFGTAAGNIAKGLGSLFTVLDKSVGSSLLDQLVRLTRSFANWASSKRGADAIQSFVDYFHRVGPQVGRTIGAVAGAVVDIAKALAPLGPPTLRVVQGIADAISAIPTPVLTALAGAFVSMVAFQKVGGFKGIGLAGKLLGGARGGGGLGGAVAAVTGKSVVPVFVTNMGEGGLGGGKGVLGKVLGGSVLEEAAPIAAAAIAAGALAYIAVKVQGGPAKPVSPGYRNSPGGMSPADSLKDNQVTVANQFHLPNPYAIAARIQSRSPSNDLANSFDALRAHAQAASRTIDLIGPHTQSATGSASKAVGAFNSKLQSIHDKKVRVTADTAAAQSQISSVQAALNAIDRIVNVHVNVTRFTNANIAGVNTPKHATGGPISGPGTGTSDSIPSYLSNGEYVVNARAAAANRPLLDQMNYGRRSYAPAASGGGATMPSHVTLRVGDQEFRAYVEGTADGVYHANQGYARAVYGQ